MRASLSSSTLVAVFLGLFSLSPQVFGQAGAAPTGTRPAASATAPAGASASAGTNVAVIDLGYVFMNATTFKNEMDLIKQKFEEFDAQMKARDKDFVAKREELAALKTGTLEYKQKEEELARMQTDAQLDMRLKQKELAEQEARVYFKTMVEVDKRIAMFAQKYRIGIVLRFNRDEMKEENVKQILNRVVVWQSQIDITDAILAELNRGVPTSTTGGGATGNGSASRPATGGAPRTGTGAGIPR